MCFSIEEIGDCDVIETFDGRRECCEQAVTIVYRDEQGRETTRAVRPIALIYYSDWMTLAGWCELRTAIRNFRTDRIASAQTRS